MNDKKKLSNMNERNGKGKGWAAKNRGWDITRGGGGRGLGRGVKKTLSQKSAMC